MFYYEKITALLLAMVLMLGITACGSEEPAQETATETVEKSPEAAYVGMWQEVNGGDKLILFDDGTGFYRDGAITNWKVSDNTIYIAYERIGGVRTDELSINGDKLVDGFNSEYKKVK